MAHPSSSISPPAPSLPLRQSTFDLKGIIAKGNEFVNWIREHFKEALTLAVIILIIVGLIYNFFMKDEKDIPDEVFQHLYKLLASSAGFPHFASIEEKSWLQLKVQQNYTKV